MADISKIKLPNGDTYDIKARKLAPLMSKTFTKQNSSGADIFGSANDAAGASFYFGSLRPATFQTPWEITYRINVYCPASANYNQSATVRMFGAGSTRSGYETTNDIYSTSYRAAYYHNLYSIQSAGFTNGYGNLIGVGLRASTNPTSSSYPRTIVVDILDVKGGTFTFFDYALKYASVPGTGSTNYNGLAEWDFANNGHRPNDNTLCQIRNENGRVYAGTVGIFPYTLIFLDKEGRYQPLVKSASTGTTKTINTDAKFMLDVSCFYYVANNTNTVGKLVASTYALYSAYQAVDLRYSTNCTTTQFVGDSPIYVECTIDADGYWSPTTNCITQTLRAGYYYIYLGNVYSTIYQLVLTPYHPVYYCEDTELVIPAPLYTETASYYLNANGIAVSSSSYKVVKYAVAGGQKLHIKASADTAGVYQFQNNVSLPTSGTNSYLKGSVVKVATDADVTVPDGAIYLMVSQANTNTTNAVKLYTKKLVDATQHRLSEKMDKVTLATVATSGSYNDLSNKPTIPAAYTLPAATSSALGGVKIGSNITNSSGTISLSKANVTAALGYTPPTQDTTYSAITNAKIDEILASI